MVRVEYVGLFSPYAHPDVQKMLAQRPKSLTERRHLALVRKELRKQESKRQMQGWARMPGVTKRTIGTRHGLSRDYQWGPRVFVVDMDPADVEILMRMHDLHTQAFRVIPDIIRVSA